MSSIVDLLSLIAIGVLSLSQILVHLRIWALRISAAETEKCAQVAEQSTRDQAATKEMYLASIAIAARIRERRQ